MPSDDEMSLGPTLDILDAQIGGLDEFMRDLDDHMDDSAPWGDDDFRRYGRTASTLDETWQEFSGNKKRKL